MLVLIDSRYQRAYVNYFEDELVRLGYDWTEVMREYLFCGREPVFNSIFANRMCFVHHAISL